jgi:hypothetical protein
MQCLSLNAQFQTGLAWDSTQAFKIELLAAFHPLYCATSAQIRFRHAFHSIVWPFFETRIVLWIAD